MASAESLLRMVGIKKSYDAPAGTKSIPVLNGIDFAMNSGEAVAIMGPSGSGKSTLLQIAGTLDSPTEGDVLLNGRSIARLKDGDLAEVRNREIGFVFQAHYLLPQCTVLENVLVPTLARRKSKIAGEAKTAEKRAERLLTRVGLGHRLSHRPGELSGGERQRVAVVRALINKPLLLLADEPTGSLDHASADSLGELLSELNREEKVAAMVVTHSPELAKRMGTVFRLQDGKLTRDKM
jgi:ABC-type lipoprotein export system ATPase subunit